MDISESELSLDNTLFNFAYIEGLGRRESSIT